MLRLLIIATTVFVISGCRVGVIVVDGGEVQSTGAEPCYGGNVCLHEVVDTNYNETFTAVADSGWEFKRWNAGGDFLCADSTSTTCQLSNTGSAGVPAFEAIIASQKTFYIMPIFEQLSVAPIDDTVILGGNEWAQPDLFVGIPWESINATCPQGECVGDLNGYDVSGWTWASVGEFNAMVNSIIGFSALGAGPDTYVDINAAWAVDALSHFRRTTFSTATFDRVLGFTRTGSSNPATAFVGIINNDLREDREDSADSSTAYSKTRPNIAVGAWLHRATP